MQIRFSLACAALMLAACQQPMGEPPAASVQPAPVAQRAPAGPAPAMTGTYVGRATLRQGEDDTCSMGTAPVNIQVANNVASVIVGSGRAASGTISADGRMAVTSRAWRLEGQFDGRNFNGFAERGDCGYAVTAAMR